MSATHLVRVIHAAQLVTMCPADPDQAFAVGEEAMGHVTIIEGERGSNIFFPVFCRGSWRIQLVGGGCRVIEHIKGGP